MNHLILNDTPPSVARIRPRTDLAEDEIRVLALLGQHTYDEVRAITGWSRGRIWRLATAASRRKTEIRIRERNAERHRRQEEFLREIAGSTVRMDVLDFLAGLPDASVGLVVTSPPYNLGKQYDDAPSADLMQYAYFHGWLMQVVAECARVLAPGGTVAFNVGQTRDWTERLLPMDVMLFEDFRRAGLTYQSRIAWTFSHGLTPKRRLAERYETVLVFTKGEHGVFNPNAARTPQKQPGKRAFKGPRKGELSGHPYGAHPSNVWHINQVGHNHPDTAHGRHGAQMPLALAKRLVLTYSLAGQLVCDPFSGSGTTQVACIEAGRDFVGADLSYERLREARVANAKPDTFTPLPGISDEAVAVWQAEARRVDQRATHTPSAEQEARMCADLFSDMAA